MNWPHRPRNLAWGTDRMSSHFNDEDLSTRFLSQDGGEIGRSVWMRTHSDQSARPG